MKKSLLIVLCLFGLCLNFVSAFAGNPHDSEFSDFVIGDKGGGWYLKEIGMPGIYDEGVNLYPNFTVGVFDKNISIDHEDLHSEIVDLNENNYLDSNGISSFSLPIENRGNSKHGTRSVGIFSGAKIGNSIGTRAMINAKTLFVPYTYNTTAGEMKYSVDAVILGIKDVLEYNGKINFTKPKIFSASMGLSGTSMSIYTASEDDNLYPEDFNQGYHFRQMNKIRKQVIEVNPDVLFVISASNSYCDSKKANGALHYDFNQNIINPTEEQLNDESNYILSKLNNLIIVTASWDDKCLASYSNYGESVDIVAPTDVMALSCSDGTNSRYSIFENYGNENFDIDMVQAISTIWDSFFGNTTPETCNYSIKRANGTSASQPIVAGAAGILLSIEPSLQPYALKMYLTGNPTINVNQRYFKTPDLLHLYGNTESLDYNLPLLNVFFAYEDLMTNMGYPDKVSRQMFNFKQYIDSAKARYYDGGYGSSLIEMPNGTHAGFYGGNLKYVIRAGESSYNLNTNIFVDTEEECASIWKGFLGLTPEESGYTSSLIYTNICHYTNNETGKVIEYNSNTGEVKLYEPNDPELLNTIAAGNDPLFIEFKEMIDYSRQLYVDNGGIDRYHDNNRMLLHDYLLSGNDYPAQLQYYHYETRQGCNEWSYNRRKRIWICVSPLEYEEIVYDYTFFGSFHQNILNLTYENDKRIYTNTNTGNVFYYDYMNRSLVYQKN